MAYFYCDFRDGNKRHCRNIVLSIISQLCEQSSLCFDTLSRIYLAHSSGKRRPDYETLTNILTEMLSLLKHDPVYLIIDALDECPDNSDMPTPREEVLELVESLVDLRLSDLHICVT